MLGAAAVRDAGADHRLREIAPCRNAQAPAVIEIGALALLCGEGLLGRRVEDEPRDEFAVALERNRDGEDRDAVQEVGGAVERIDDPAMGAVGAFDLAALLHEEAVAGTSAGEFLVQDLLGAVIRGADEVRGTFQRDLKLLDLAEVAREAPSGLAGGGKHHVHQRRGGHGRAFISSGTVMPGLVPGIHGFLAWSQKTWMAGTSPAMDEDSTTEIRWYGIIDHSARRT